MEDGAEQKCSEAINEALKLDKNHYEVLYTLANFRFVQQKNEEALDCAKRSFMAWKDSINDFFYFFLIGL